MEEINHILFHPIYYWKEDKNESTRFDRMCNAVRFTMVFGTTNALGKIISHIEILMVVLSWNAELGDTVNMMRCSCN
jgi:hypothetical protein